MYGIRHLGLSSLLLILSTIVALTLALAPDKNFAAEPIKIGVIDAFSGPAAAFGEPALLGWKMAIEEINASGGLIGRKIEVVVRDDQFSEGKALAAAEELVLKENVDFLGGTSSSSSALAVSKVAEEHKKIFMVHIARSDRITGEKGHKYVFSACPNSIIEGKSGARYAKHKKYLKWFIVGEDYEYGRSIALSFWRELSRLAPTVEKLGEAWAPLKTADYSPLITEIMAKNPSAVYVAFGVSGMTRFLAQAGKAGLLEKTRLFLNLMADPVLISGLNNSLLTENAFGSSSYLWFYPNTPANAEFVRKYDEFVKQAGTSQPIPPGFAVFGGYCSARFLGEAIRKAGTLDVERVITALEGITIETPIGPITMRSCDHQALTPTYWGRIQNTRGLAMPTLLSPYDVVPADLLPGCEDILRLRK